MLNCKLLAFYSIFGYYMLYTYITSNVKTCFQFQTNKREQFVHEIVRHEICVCIWFGICSSLCYPKNASKLSCGVTRYSSSDTTAWNGPPLSSVCVSLLHPPPNILQNMSTNALQVAKPEATQYISSFVCVRNHTKTKQWNPKCVSACVFYTQIWIYLFVWFRWIHAFPIRTAPHEFVMNEWMNEWKKIHCVVCWVSLPCEWMPWIWCANTINPKIIIFSILSIVLKRPIIGRCCCDCCSSSSSCFPRRFLLLLLLRWPLCRSSNFTFFISPCVFPSCIGNWYRWIDILLAVFGLVSFRFRTIF